jgi:hypothetical protein
MTDRELPEPAYMTPMEGMLFTADQMHAYAAACVAEERERCAKVCESAVRMMSHRNADVAWYAGAATCAAAIRAGSDA